MAANGKYPPLPHPNGGVIYRAFWLCAPVSPEGAKKLHLLKDAIQEQWIIALELQGVTDLKTLSNKTQRVSYNFWKKYGFRKVRIATEKNTVAVLWRYDRGGKRDDVE